MSLILLRFEPIRIYKKIIFHPCIILYKRMFHVRLKFNDIIVISITSRLATFASTRYIDSIMTSNLFRIFFKYRMIGPAITGCVYN